MWLIGLASALLVFVAPLAIIEARSGASTELRVVATGDRLSIDILDGEHRVLVMNAVRIADARSALGRLGRPWEARAGTIIAPGGKLEASGLWEAIQTLQPRQIFVVDAPGAGQTWSMIERHTREAGIELRYVSDAVTFRLDDLSISLLPSSGVGRNDPGVVVRRGEINVAIALGPEIPQANAQVLITSAGTSPQPQTDLLITNRRLDAWSQQRGSVLVGRSDRVNVRFAGDRLYVTGGNYIAGTR